MEQWIRQNRLALIPWAILSLEVVVNLGIRLSKLNSHDRDDEVIPSPLQTLLPKLSEIEAAELPYPPDALPGSRDVASPYGSLRVYEWGPEDGRKVVMVHGISNPCIVLGAVAHGLVDRGCRVILFDLPGRGYSSIPASTPQSARLFSTSILLAITSSSIPWTGNNNGFSLIGYSLGGGIVANFTSFFPSLVSSLVLLAPAGLVRRERFRLKNKLLFNTGLVNEKTLEWIVSRRLKRGDPPIEPPKKLATNATAGEEPPKEKEGGSPVAVLSRSRPGVTTGGIVAWQINFHQGYVKAFISSIRHGPVASQHPYWRRISERLSAQNALSEEKYEKEGLQNGKVLIITGKKDEVIAEEEIVEDAAIVFGAGNVRFESVNADHDLPITRSEDILKHISEFWKL